MGGCEAGWPPRSDSLSGSAPEGSWLWVYLSTYPTPLHFIVILFSLLGHSTSGAPGTMWY